MCAAALGLRTGKPFVGCRHRRVEAAGAIGALGWGDRANLDQVMWH
jgi:hypothetical protein